MKKESGITLIALVITIIVLLILAGVTIAMLTGENGLLNRATSTTVAQKVAEAKDNASLDVMDAYTEYMEEYYGKGNTSASISYSVSTDCTGQYTFNTTDNTVTILKTFTGGDNNIVANISNGSIDWANATEN